MLADDAHWRDELNHSTTRGAISGSHGEPPPERREFDDPWRAWVAYLLLALVLGLIVALPVASAWRPRPVETTSIGVPELFAGQFVLATFLVLWFLLQQRAPLRAFLALPHGAWTARFARGVRLGVLAWLSTIAAMAVLTLIARNRGIEAQPGFADLVLWLATRSIALRLALVLTAMMVEEAFFRAFLQPRIGVFAATVCFATSHLSYGSPTMGGGVFVIGLILALAFRRHRDIAVCAVAHGVFDSIQLLIVLPLIAQRL